MTTANARTNSVGHTVSGHAGSFGDTFCKTDQFHISTDHRRGGVFHPEGKLSRHARDDGKHCIGDFIGRDGDVGIIASELFEAGVPLSAPCVVMHYKPENKRGVIELWTRHERFKVIRGRVYGHRILSGHWHIPASMRGR